MPEEERNEAIDRVITELLKEEKRQRDAQEAADHEMAQQQQETFTPSLTSQQPPVRQSQQGNGEWYFYNPVAVSQGKATFQRQWGRRENKDNWQRINQTVVASTDRKDDDITPDTTDIINFSETDDIQQALSDTLSSATNDPHERAYYLAQIPFTTAQKAAAHDIIKDGLFHAGMHTTSSRMDYSMPASSSRTNSTNRALPATR